jgi:hypothetical protein
MDISPNNPAANSIGPGIDERQILSAVEASGYPLQTNVAEVLRPYFEQVQQEWCYLDKDSGELRSIDIWAEQALHEWDPQPRVRPTLNLLIECKQSQLPYIFFPSISPAHSVHFPATRNNEETVLTLLPWVRVVRHEYSERAPLWERNRLWAIDVVHKSFLNQFLTNHLLPFATEFSDRALRHQTELATGEGFIAGMGASSFDGLEGRLRPRSVESRSKRTAIIANNFLRFLFRRPEKD